MGPRMPRLHRGRRGIQIELRTSSWLCFNDNLWQHKFVSLIMMMVQYQINRWFRVVCFLLFPANTVPLPYWNEKGSSKLVIISSHLSAYLYGVSDVDVIQRNHSHWPAVQDDVQVRGDRYLCVHREASPPRAKQHVWKRRAADRQTNTSGSPLPFGTKHTKSNCIGKTEPTLARGSCCGHRSKRIPMEAHMGTGNLKCFARKRAQAGKHFRFSAPIWGQTCQIN